MAYPFRRGPRTLRGFRIVPDRPRVVRIVRVPRDTSRTLQEWYSGALKDAPVGLRRVQIAS